MWILTMIWAGIGVALAFRQGQAHGADLSNFETMYIRIILGIVLGPFFPIVFPINKGDKS